MRRFVRVGLATLVLGGLFGSEDASARGEVSSSAIQHAWLVMPLWPGRFRRISSHFGRRRWGRHTEFHRGIDLVAPRGSYVVAAREGRIVQVAHDRRCGWYVKVAHAYGWHTVYCHLLEDPRKGGIQPGMTVVTGQVVGRVGRTGRATGHHLHFGLIDPKGSPQNPEPHMLPTQWSQQWLQALYTSR